MININDIQSAIDEYVSNEVAYKEHELELQYQSVVDECVRLNRIIERIGLPDYPLMEYQYQLIRDAIEHVLQTDSVTG